VRGKNAVVSGYLNAGARGNASADLMATVTDAAPQTPVQIMDELVQKYEATADDARDKYKALCNILKRVFQLEGLPWSGAHKDDKCCKRYYVTYYVQHMFDVPPTHLEGQHNLVRLRVTFLFSQLPVELSCNAKIEVLIIFLAKQLKWLTAKVGRYLDDGAQTTEAEAAIADDVLNAVMFVGRIYEKDTFPAFRRPLKWAILDRVRQLAEQPLEDVFRSEEDQRRQNTVVLLLIYGELSDA